MTKAQLNEMQLIVQGAAKVDVTINNELVQGQTATRTIYRNEEGNYFLHDEFTNPNLGEVIKPVSLEDARFYRLQLAEFAPLTDVEFKEPITELGPYFTIE